MHTAASAVINASMDQLGKQMVSGAFGGAEVGGEGVMVVWA